MSVKVNCSGDYLDEKLASIILHRVLPKVRAERKSGAFIFQTNIVWTFVHFAPIGIILVAGQSCNNIARPIETTAQALSQPYLLLEGLIAREGHVDEFAARIVLLELIIQFAAIFNIQTELQLGLEY